MERNDDFSTPNTGVGGTSGAGSTGSDFGSTTGGTAGAGYGTSGTTGSEFGAAGGAGTAGTTGGFGGPAGTGGTEAGRMQHGKEVVAEKFGAVKERVQNLDVKGKVQNLNATLADKLEQGADKLRQRSQSGQLAGATGGAMGATSDVGDQQRMAQYGDKAAAGLEGAAEWLRNGDLKETVETQVRTNPGRTLLIALGLGYVLGKALRK
jgi:hypothetical protein